MNRWNLAAALAALAVLSGVVRAEDADDRALQIERQHVHYVVDAEGRYVETRETATQVLKDSVLESAKTASVSYSTSIQQAEVVSAYTLKPDGRRIEVPAGNYQIHASSGHEGDSPVYSDNTRLTVVFPDLQVGDTTVFGYRLTAREPMFPGHFSVIESFDPSRYYGDVQVTVDAPATLRAGHQHWQLREAVREEAGRRIVQWTWHNREPVKRETLRDSVYNPERYPGYAYSTFESYADIARAYGGPAGAKAVSTTRIRELAAEVAGDAADSRETTRRLYEWVSRNITYAGNCIGLGAVVPRDLDSVLDNRMGDCKDHATLLQALLAAKGIQSTQALVNAGRMYALPKVPVASAVNHVINYVPELDLYLDATPSNVPFGSLPQGIAGKPVLLVDGHHDGAATPLREMGRDGQKMVTELRIAEDGSIRGSHRLELSGQLAMAARGQFRDVAASEAGQMVRRYFEQMALDGKGTIRYPDPGPMQEDFSIEAEFELGPSLPASGGFGLQPWFISYVPVAAIVAARAGSLEQPPGESGCSSMYSEEEFVIELPESAQIVAIPADVEIEEGNLGYRSRHVREGNRLHVSRRLDDRTQGPLCSPDYNAEVARTMRRIVPSLRQQVVYVDPQARAD